MHRPTKKDTQIPADCVSEMFNGIIDAVDRVQVPAEYPASAQERAPRVTIVGPGRLNRPGGTH